MITADTSSYDGWDIDAHCHENKPDDWKPGEPIPYLANLRARLHNTPEFPFEWTGQKQFTIPEHGARTFYDWNEAYRSLKREAHEKIDEIRRMQKHQGLTSS
ncbi:hypothetical protein GTP55_25540 [Duganella sp. FT109W]|uniref:Uncharacterized protein n=1 Tax=Duganella margarita TaxID=2692170 RepID=A0ABW9WNB5_9BURK|nr:hypothetical protein [Duganella margarita]MYN42712.1 hypothetical protein [Duganella margarita]